MTPLLELHEVSAGYANSIVIEDLSFSVGRGEVVCLLGANGAGKTTTMRVITGLIEPYRGKLLFDGTDLLSIPAYDRPQAGICLSPEGRHVFPNLSAEDNLRLGSYSRRARIKRNETLAMVYELFPKMKERRKQKAGLMSGGEQQMLAIGRALMGLPELLMLDEPSLGLAPVIVQHVFDAVFNIASSGISILLVEQNANAALSIATRGYVLAGGKVVVSGTADELEQSSLVREAFLGAVPSSN